MAKDNCGPAFPTFKTHDIGITKRDYFAAMALQGMLAAGDSYANHEAKHDCAKYAYQFADAMLEERDK